MTAGYFLVRYPNAPEVQVEIAFERPVFVVGSDPRCDLQLGDPAIESSHVIVSLQEGTLFVKPRYTKAQVWINGALIREQTALYPGDQLRVGDTILELQTEPEAETPPATAADHPRSAPAAVMAPALRAAPASPVIRTPHSARPAMPAASRSVAERIVTPAPTAAVYYPQSASAGKSGSSRSGVMAAFLSILILVGVGGYAAVTQFVGTPAAASEYAMYAPGTVQIVMFYADWCQYCKQQRPIVNGLDNEFGEAVSVRFVDVENPANRTLVSRFGATSIPVTVVLDSKGEAVSIWRGLTSRQRLHRAIEKVLEAALPPA